MMPGAGDTDYPFPAYDSAPDEGEEGRELKLTQEDAPREQSELFKGLPQRASNEEHVSDGGERCPFCRSDEIEGGSVSTGGGSAWQSMSCGACRSTWYDHYSLTGYTKR